MTAGAGLAANVRSNRSSASNCSETSLRMSARQLGRPSLSVATTLRSECTNPTSGSSARETSTTTSWKLSPATTRSMGALAGHRPSR